MERPGGGWRLGGHPLGDRGKEEWNKELSEDGLRK